MGQFEQIDVDGHAMDAYVAAAAGTGPSPGVVLMHGRKGVVDFTTDHADGLAKAGFVVVAPNIFHRSPKDEDLSAKVDAVLDDEAIQDIGAAIDFLKGRQDVAGDKLAILGHCLGGRMSFVGASTFPDFSASVVYYSSGMFGARGDRPAPFELLKDVACPVLGLFGGKDHNPTPEQVDKIDTELTRHDIDHRFYSYPDAAHAFQDTERPERFNAEASSDAWEKAVNFLHQHLSPPAS
jgi:carboxymethylenebutenolidase